MPIRFYLLHLSFFTRSVKIQNGTRIRDTYQVISDAISGGMGEVWKVHHDTWNVDLAMKRPQPLFFSESGPAQKRVFIKECENWITLGDTNRSYECLAAAAFKYGVSYPDNEKVKEARDIYAMLVKYSSDYQDRLDMANKVLKSTDELQDKIRGILRKDTEL